MMAGENEMSRWVFFDRDVFTTWCEIGNRLSLHSHNEIAAYLIERYKTSADLQIKCHSCGSPVPNLCSSCLQQSQFQDTNSEDKTEALQSLASTSWQIHCHPNPNLSQHQTHHSFSLADIKKEIEEDCNLNDDNLETGELLHHIKQEFSDDSEDSYLENTVDDHSLRVVFSADLSTGNQAPADATFISKSINENHLSKKSHANSHSGILNLHGQTWDIHDNFNDDRDGTDVSTLYYDDTTDSDDQELKTNLNKKRNEEGVPHQIFQVSESLYKKKSPYTGIESKSMSKMQEQKKTVGRFLVKEIEKGQNLVSKESDILRKDYNDGHADNVDGKLDLEDRTARHFLENSLENPTNRRLHGDFQNYVQGPCFVKTECDLQPQEEIYMEAAKANERLCISNQDESMNNNLKLELLETSSLESAESATHYDHNEFGNDGCKETATSNSSLKVHFKRHTKVYDKNTGFASQGNTERDINSTGLKDGAYQCQLCDKTYKTKPTLKRHILEFHEQVRPFSCDKCGKSFNRNADLQLHFSVHSDLKPFKCEICNIDFKTIVTLRHHAAYKHKARLFICEFCRQLFNSKEDLNAHKVEHLKVDQSLDQNSQFSVLESFTCEQCKKSFKSEQALNTHKLVHTEPEEGSSGLSLNKQCIETQSLGRHCCHLCSRSFTSNLKLSHHISHFHNEVKSFSCDKCDKTFSSPVSLDKHVQSKHCHNGLCEKVSRVKHSSESKMKNNAVVDLPGNQTETLDNMETVSCPECQRVVKKRSLKTHIRVHTGEKPYKCDICGKTFTQSQTMKRHRFLHSKLRPIICNVCNMAFPDKSALAVHKRKHSGKRSYKCEICSKTFVWHTSYHQHLRIHTGDKPHVCDICNKGFTASNDLKKHKQRHERRKAKLEKFKKT